MKLDDAKKQIKAILNGKKPKPGDNYTIYDNGKTVQASCTRVITTGISYGNTKDSQDSFYFKVQGINGEVEIVL